MSEGAYFSHETALILWGCPLRKRDELHISVPHERHAPERKGVRGHRIRSPLSGRTVTGVPLIDPPLAIMQAAVELPMAELVVAIDHLVRPLNRGSPPIISHEHLGQLMLETSLRGVKKAREAWRRSRVGAESRMETLLRLKLEDEGIRELELQVELFDEEGFIGRFDLLDRRTRTIYEYDGEQHRTVRVQYLKDVRRLDRARRAGWRVVRFHHEDLFTGPVAFRRVLNH